MSIFEGEMLLQRMQNLVEWSKEFEPKLDGMDRGNFKEVMKFYESQKKDLESKINLAKHDTKINY